jgi:hypothetical protein
VLIDKCSYLKYRYRVSTELGRIIYPFGPCPLK